MNEATLGNFSYSYNNDIQIQYFMSDCKESIDDNNKYNDSNNKNKIMKAKIKIYSLLIMI